MSARISSRQFRDAKATGSIGSPCVLTIRTYKRGSVRVEMDAYGLLNLAESIAEALGYIKREAAWPIARLVAVATQKGNGVA